MRSSAGGIKGPGFLVALRDDLLCPSFREYILKASLGITFFVVLWRIFPKTSLIWSAVSVGLVLSPEDKDTFRFGAERMAANALGSAVGWAASLTGLDLIAQVLMAAPAVILAASALGIRKATRSALAALVIVMSAGAGNIAGFTPSQAALERAAFVILGCIFALGLAAAAIGLRKLFGARGGAACP
jgi:hypothetical protein